MSWSGGCGPVAASAVSQASLDRVSARLPQAKIARPEEVVEASDLVLLTVPDDALPGLVKGLADTGVAMEGRLIAHASGRHGEDRAAIRRQQRRGRAGRGAALSRRGR